MMKVAYENPQFMNGLSARPLRILAEYFEPKNRLAQLSIVNTVVFFGSARISPPLDNDDVSHLSPSTSATPSMAQYYAAAEETAYLLTKRLNAHERLVSYQYVLCTGGGPGIMEAGNKGAVRASGRTMGFGIQLPFEQAINSYIPPEYSFNFHYFFMRKYWFSYLAKAVVVFPGGFGTLDELFEVLTLLQTKKMVKKCPIVLYGSAFWSHLINFDFLLACGLISAEDRDYFVILDTPEDVVDYLEKSLDASHVHT